MRPHLADRPRSLVVEHARPLLHRRTRPLRESPATPSASVSHLTAAGLEQVAPCYR